MFKQVKLRKFIPCISNPKIYRGKKREHFQIQKRKQIYAMQLKINVLTDFGSFASTSIVLMKVADVLLLNV
jgi:hypothetical protein